MNKTEKINRQAVWIDLGLMEYRLALHIQTSAMQEKIENPEAEDKIFFVQHPPVFTLGKRGGQENLIVSKEFLAKKKCSNNPDGSWGKYYLSRPWPGHTLSCN